MLTKIQKKKGALTWYDEGKSIYSLKEAFPVIIAPFGYILIDGHHSILVSEHFNAATVPITIIADLQALTEEEFWEVAEENKWVYPFAIGGKRVILPKSFAKLQDDPNRYFATLITRKYAANGTSSGAEYPVWLKTPSSPPFVEWLIADELRKGNIVYTYSMGAHPKKELIEQARSCLVNAHLQEVTVLPHSTHYTQIEYNVVGKPICHL